MTSSHCWPVVALFLVDSSHATDELSYACDAHKLGAHQPGGRKSSADCSV